MSTNRMAIAHSHKRINRGVLLFLIGVLLAVYPFESNAQAPNEYQVKAAFILNFAKFVDWPNEAFTSGSLVVGIIGDDPFGGSLEQILNGNSANGRRVTVKRFRWGDNLRECQILFVSSSESKRLPSILNSLNGASVLTIGENAQFNQTGGVIRFFIQGNRVRFEINGDAAAYARLRISSKLMALSKGGKN